MLRRLWPFIRPYRGRIAIAALFLLLAAGASLAIPLALRQLIDAGLAAAPDERLGVIGRHFGTMAVLGLAFAAFTAVRFYQVSWLGERITCDLRSAVYRNVLRQRPVFFETLQTGEVLSRLSADATLVQTVVGSSASMGLRSLVTAVGALILLVAIHPILVLSVAAVLGGFVGPLVLLGRRLRRLSRASQDRLADSNATAGEVLESIQLVQSYGRENDEADRYRAAVERGFEAARRRFRVRAAMSAFIIGAIFLGNLYGLYLGVSAVIDGRISAGTLSQIAVLIAMLASSAAVLAEVSGDLIRASGALERLFELLDAEPADVGAGDGASESAGDGKGDGRAVTTLASGAKPVRALAPAAASPAAPSTAAIRIDASDPDRGVPISFEGVGFHYPARPGASALEDFSLAIEAGTTVALVGASGAGKSTVFRLLQRFYEVDEGAIRVDGQVIADRPLAEVRARYAVVAQESTVLSGTIADNIRYGRPRASLDEVKAAARAAYADAFIERLPAGYDTEVGERGLRLSGGERQRIAIARAILADRPVLLLDEATSALDPESEAQVRAALAVARRGRTTLVIAHRLATVRDADRIVLMDHGRIIASGSHRELMAESAGYRRLVRLQWPDEGDIGAVDGEPAAEGPVGNGTAGNGRPGAEARGTAPVGTAPVGAAPVRKGLPENGPGDADEGSAEARREGAAPG